MPLPIPRLAHRQVVRKGTNPTRGASMPCSMASVTVGMPRSSMALQTSPTDRWHKGHEGVSSTASTPSSTSLSGDLGGGHFDERGRVVDGAHKGEVARSELAYQTVFDESAQRLEGEDGVEVGAFVGAIVGVGPGEVFGVGGDLTVGAIAFEVVYVEALLVGKMYAPCRDERETGPVEGFLRPDERHHPAQTLKRTSTVSPSSTT